LTSPSLVSQSRLSRVWPARFLLLRSSPSGSLFPPILPLYSPSTRWTWSMESLSLVPRPSVYNRGSASGRGPNGEDSRKKKTTETEARSPLATVYTCTISGRSIPGKIWMPTNQITAISARAHVFRELRARAPRHLGVYKESQVAHRLSRVRVS